MHILDFNKLKLEPGDYIWLQNEKGEGFPGNFNGKFDPNNQSFEFRNHSNGKTELIYLAKLQRLDLVTRNP